VNVSPAWPRRRVATLLAATALAISATALGSLVPMPIPGSALRPAVAADPTASPSASPTWSAEPTPGPSLGATPTATPTASPDGTVAPVSPVPTPETTPDPTPDPTPVTPGPTDPSPADSPSSEPSPAEQPPDASGTPEPLPQSTASPLPSATPLISYQLSSGQQEGTAVGAPIPLYRLVLPSAGAEAPGADAGTGSPHTGYTLTSPDCASCHATHTAQGAALAAVAPQTSLCYGCHAGSGSSLDVAADFTGLPANDETTDSYYTHPVTDASRPAHDAAATDEFGGVLNRHTACADCHDPHDATAVRPQQSTTGWTAPGAIAAATGIAVSNGPAGSTPTYRLVGGGQAPLTYEYELCLTCHSGWTELPSRSASSPSTWALDKGVELNPANTSYHPIEAAGTNQTAQMAASLAGTSPFKAWDFSTDATIRCTSCHGDPSTVNQVETAAPQQPPADATEPAHGSPNRGLLIAPYRDRELKPVGEAYDSSDFALCYLCHAERPFVDPNVDAEAPDTLFPAHGAHVSLDEGSAGAGLSIDHPGDGGGLALCAECHFRIHSTALAYEPGDTAPVARASGNPALVGFAPDVIGPGAGGGGPTWNQPNSQGQGSCALTCHGVQHSGSAFTYVVAPGTAFSAWPTSGPAGAGGLLVQFTDATRYVSASGATWSWDFGDGSVSNAQNPSHVYAAPGSYTVTLTVRRTSGNMLEATLSRAGYIVVTP
jgi:predicted CXXCH cytochrome family protein